MLLDIPKLFAHYKKSEFHNNVVVNIVFNDMMMTEYTDYLTTSIIDDFLLKYGQSNVKLNGHGMNELVICSQRWDLADYCIEKGIADPCAMDIYRLHFLGKSAAKMQVRSGAWPGGRGERRSPQ